MRKGAIFAVTGYILLLFSSTFMIPISTALVYGEPGTLIVGAYALPMLISAGIGFALWFNSRDRVEDLRERDAFVVVGLGWVAIAAFGALPYILGGVIDNPLDAYFESMSGFTTTGATIMTVPPGMDYLDVYPHSIMMWRSVTAWLGGMGIIVFGVVILARFLEGGLHLFKAEVSGGAVTRLRPKLHQTARILWGVYGLFTILSFIMLMGAGMSPFDAVNTSFSTLATGGFSVHVDNIGFYDSLAIEIIVMAFMIVGALSFVLHYKLITGKLREVFRDPEMRFFMAVLAASAYISGMALFLADFGTGGESMRAGFFQTVSAGTTGGFFTQPQLGAWPPIVHIILILLMLFGATVGSTGGGLKAARFLILLKNTKRGIMRSIHPRAVVPLKIGGKTISEGVIEKVQMLFFAFIMVFGIATIILCANGHSVLESAAAVAGSLGNAGIGIFEPGSGYHTLDGISKTTLIFSMWIGRLEIITGLIVLAPSTYRS